MYQSRFDALFPFETKALRHVGLIGHNVSGTNQIGIQYKIPSDVSYTNMGTISDEPGDKINPSGTPADKAFDFKVTITNASSGSAPTLDTLVVFSAIRFENLKEIVAWVNVSNEVLDRRGAIIRTRWQDVRNKIENMADQAGSVTVISPTGEILTCLAVDFGHALLMEDTEKKQFRWMSRIRMIQTRASATRGTWDRAATYIWDDLAAFTWDEVRVI